MTWQTVWEAYDVPRIWDAVHLEDDPLGWEQVYGLRRAAEMLTGHSEGLRAKREVVARAWQGPAAALMLSRLDGLITSVTRDAASLTVATHGLHGIMTALAAARKKVQPLALRWDEVTSDWIPEFWDEVAAELNDEARTAMLVAAAEVRDHAGRLAAPEILRETATAAPPPLPGYSPTTSDGPRLAGMPRSVPAMPGHPVSMLPTPPGNPYAPAGGAYLLPGPGVGPHGFILPMAAATPPSVRHSVWRVPKGVPPVILPVADSPTQPTPETMAGFHHWFSGLATPWRSSAPRV